MRSGPAQGLRALATPRHPPRSPPQGQQAPEAKRSVHVGPLTPPVQRRFREFESRGCGAGHVTAGRDAAAGRRGDTRGGVAAPRLAEAPKGRGLKPERRIGVEPRRAAAEMGCFPPGATSLFWGFLLIFLRARTSSSVFLCKELTCVYPLWE